MRQALATILCAAALGGAPAGEARAEEPTVDASGLPTPAWQTDPALATEWRLLTGRYIFQRACASCHPAGPGLLSRGDWETYLAAFPDNHAPDVRKAYSDLTARFLPGRMVPNADQRTDALTTFLLSAAPETVPAPPTEPRSHPADPWEGLPRVGDPVPDFAITDLAGRRHSPADYRDRRHLVLVFSRAHW